MPANKRTGYDYSMDRKTIDDPETMPLESVDMFGIILTTQLVPISSKVVLKMNTYLMVNM